MSLINRLRVVAGRARREFAMKSLRERLEHSAPGELVTIGNLRLRITDGPNAYMQYKDEFVQGIYRFTTTNPSPLVVDGGANMGMFSIVTKRDHPGARIIAFEPDPAVYGILQENLQANGVHDVTLVNAGLAGTAGTATFAPDGEAGGKLSDAGPVTVNVETLSTYLTEPVDFMKLNIEGVELDVLREAADSGKLKLVRAMTIEYHGWAGGEQRLGPLLTLLDEQGFRYLLHDFDEQSNPTTKPPFRAPGTAPWFALVHAWRTDHP
jgi:FkbM family methyltransferase